VKPDRDYPLLLGGQFLGAFGDNFLLAAILSPLTYELAAGRIGAARVGSENAVYSAVFFVPFIVLAPIAGFLNDRMPKTSWLLGGNLVKAAGSAAGLAGSLMAGAAGHAWQVAGYAVVGIGACVYSPAKYGILPEILPEARLVKANGTVEMLTLVAIVLGLGGGAWLYDEVRSLPACYAAAILLYAVALLLNAAMARSPSNPAARFGRTLSEFRASLASLLGNPRLGRILLGSGLFWFAGATLRTNLQGWGLEVFREAGVATVTNTRLVLLKIGLVLGASAGAMLAGQLHRTGDLRRTRPYGFALAGSVALLGLLGGSLGLWVVVLALIAAGVSGALLVVPLNAALQAESDSATLGKTVSVQNFVDYLSMLAGAGFLALTARLGLAPTGAFVALGAVLAALAAGLRIRPARPPE
jgi:LPLT family lysophospholipid transporter-like MFS transporter